MSKTTTAYDAVVVGAGFSGLYMLHKLRQIGLSALVIEEGNDVGGTWYWNRYPGARCDSESHYYSYSFSPELEQEWEWSSKYPDQPEILSYLQHVADRFDLRRDILFGTRVTGAVFDEDAARWGIETDSGRRFSARYLITAVGCLSAGQLPDIPGRDAFAGEWYHTGRWPHEGVEVSGKRVGVIGTGATGIQLIPVVAETAEHLYVFQRTPNFSIPARNAPLDTEETRRVKARYRALREHSRASFAGMPFDPIERSALAVPPEEREATYERLWQVGGFRFLFEGFNDLLMDKASNDTAAEFIRRKIRETVHDPAVAEQLCPNSYPFGTKRPPLNTAYFETFNRDNVTLVDIRSHPITEITPEGVRTTAGDYELDVIIFATGFDAMTGALLNMGIRGRGGLSLAEKWADGPRSYLGLAVNGFPNLFTITGPGSPSVLSNMPVSIEQHVEWIADCLAHLEAEGAEFIEARPEAEAGWVEHVNQVADATLFPLADSWYIGANIPGKPRVFMPYVGGVGTYRQICEDVAAKGYEGFALGVLEARS
ncbi:MAG: NAD(P)/FAD-dependent oxidoreductase [Pseudomonadota bacterium]